MCEMRWLGVDRVDPQERESSDCIDACSRIVRIQSEREFREWRRHRSYICFYVVFMYVVCVNAHVYIYIMK